MVLYGHLDEIRRIFGRIAIGTHFVRVQEKENRPFLGKNNPH